MNSDPTEKLTGHVNNLSDTLKRAVQGEYELTCDETRSTGALAPLIRWTNQILEERRNLLDEVVSLQTVVNISQKISSLVSLDTLLHQLADLAKRSLEAEACSIALVEEITGDLVFEYVEGGAADQILKMRIPRGKGIAGRCLRENSIQIIDDVSQTKDFFKQADELTSFQTRNLVAVPLKYKGTIIGVLELVNVRDIEHFINLKRSLLEAFANVASVAIVNSKLHEKAIETTKMEQELQIARQIQMTLLPDQNPFPDDISLGTFYQAARLVGGDYYDVIHTGQETMDIVMADVSGKSISGALMMVITRSITRTAALRHSTPLEIVREINSKLIENTAKISQGMFVTMAYVSLNKTSNMIRFSRAGHTPLLVYRGKTGEVEHVYPSGIALGLDAETIFESTLTQEKIFLSPDDLCMLYTDGLSEAMSADGAFYGEERIDAFLRKHGTKPMGDFMQALADEHKQFTLGCQQSDDVTVVIFKRK